MNRNAIACILWLKFAISRVKVALCPMSLNATSDNKPKLTFKIEYADAEDMTVLSIHFGSRI